MRCEVCGRQIRGEPRKVIIEEAKMIVCEECSRLGSPYLEPANKLSKSSYTPVKEAKTFPRTIPLTKKEPTSLHEELELKENFGTLIREAREKLGLSHEDIGRKIGEKVSLLKKVENEKMLPDEKVAAKLEHILRIKLLVPAKENRLPVSVSHSPSTAVTLGEIARLKTGKRRYPENEGASGSEETPL